jgi:HEPN domain-containing protein
MNDIEHAKLLLSMARKDLKALEGMLDTSVFEDEIFGFHVQQAAEKALKSWLSAIGLAYPKTHNLRLLLTLLSDSGADVQPFWDLIEYNVFAVQVRYEGLDMLEEPIDRELALKRAIELVGRVEKVLKLHKGEEQ